MSATWCMDDGRCERKPLVWRAPQELGCVIAVAPARPRRSVSGVYYTVDDTRRLASRSFMRAGWPAAARRAARGGRRGLRYDPGAVRSQR